MHTLDFYFDPISPYAYLAFHQLPKTLEGLSVVVRYKPVLFGAMLNANGQKGPAEIDGKREWTYRQALWQAKKMGLPMTMPAAHPFNPLPLLRAMLAAADSDGAVNRYVAEQAFSRVWTSAQDPASEQFLMAFNAVVDTHLTRRGNDALASDAVKLCLRHNTEAALDAGVFGVPTVVVNGYVFWGLDGLDMLRGYLNDPAWFDNAQGEWQQAAHVPVGIKRQ